MKPWGAANLDYAEAAVGADFLLHAVQMVFHGLFGEAKTIGNFFVGEPFGDERNELLFAAGQAEPPVNTRGREGSGFALEVAE